MPGALRAAQVPFSTAPDFNVTKLDLVGLQLYTARSEMAKNVEATLEKVAAVGYREVEFAGYFNRDPVALRAKLDSLTLTAPACTSGCRRSKPSGRPLPPPRRHWATSG